MYKLYRWMSIIFSPFIKLYFHYRCMIGKEEKKSIENRFGIATSSRPAGNIVWIHAASVGESTSALSYIKHITGMHPNWNVLLTTVTLTSANLLKDKKFDQLVHQFIVADVPNWINKFLDYWNPQKAIFLESEIWPNIVHELTKKNIPTYLINARLSDTSVKRWRFAKTSFAKLLQQYEKIMAQSQNDVEKFSSFYSDNVMKMDNLKFANELLPYDEKLLQAFKSLCFGKFVFVATSTHEGEDEIILTAHKQLSKRFPLTTIIIPRHTKRVNTILSLCESMGLTCVKRSQLVTGTIKSSEIFCVDTYGEVGTFYRLAHITFVGGSLVPIGGHNILEPVMLQKPVLHGPFMNSCQETVDWLHDAHAAFEVKNADDIITMCSFFFNDTKELHKFESTIASQVHCDALQQLDAIIKY